MSQLTEILAELHSRDGSDLVLKFGRPPLMRLSGQLLPSEFPVQDDDSIQANLGPVLSDFHWQKLKKERDVDLSFEIEGMARFRVNVFYQRGHVGTVIRLIPLTTPTIDEMGLPAVLKDVAVSPNGIVLVTGPTGSGKSTTLAAVVQHINNTRHAHVITIEDPVEFVYTDDKATITQRGIGEDTLSAGRALRAALRQNPDVILAGEMRDRETMELALHAAETGHLVLSTLHTNDAKQSITRITDAFPPENKTGLLRMLSNSLRAVVSQRLLRKADGSGRVAAHEIMIVSPTIKLLIEKGDIHGMEKAIASSSSYYRMQSFNQCFADLVDKRQITQEVALLASTSPGDLKLMLKGMSRSSGALGGSSVVEEGTAPPPPSGRRRPPRPSRRVMGRGGRPAQGGPGRRPPSAPPEGKGERKPKINRGFDFT
ncbi:MAG: PilT/PilU family type 4a pilus ATPase [Planctomycetes bacterium]|nr:PilT/PilU family type 4a pilus ATPase [Planctomycetota bacterium]